MKRFAATVVTAALVAATGSASAAYAVYFGEDLNNSPSVPLSSIPNASAADAGFRSNLSGVGTETFESQTPGASAPLVLSFPGFGGSISATLEGGGGQVGFAASGTANNGRYSIPSASSTNYWSVNAGSGGNFTVTFSKAIAAFGFYGVDVGDFGGQLQIQLLSGQTVLDTLTVNNSIGAGGSTDGSVLFYGIQAGNAAEEFDGVRFSMSSGVVTDVFAFDNFTIAERDQIGPPPPPGVPEPATLALLGLALAGAGMARRRK